MGRAFPVQLPGHRAQQGPLLRLVCGEHDQGAALFPPSMSPLQCTDAWSFEWLHVCYISLPLPQYGDTWAVTLPTKPWIVVVTDKASLDHILRTNFENYVKGMPPPRRRFVRMLRRRDRTSTDSYPARLSRRWVLAHSLLTATPLFTDTHLMYALQYLQHQWQELENATADRQPFVQSSGAETYG